ncbi:competence protein ComEA [Candidatus Thermokryptus mobilis]|uniref:Competence protein ComEA n=1 Tax=Candidatus Thermokryptus mobilis TaxID=1643428 RepID=A0A0S4MS20_9BACT|nr:helix-hairpin-helix domain-containing protein [Candidatus Thermokryptus mobilis]CUU01384.1 competence protein ComEA [Candidatus Thermokryptus mobilis]
MKSFLKKINDVIGLTKSESVVFWFLIIAFVFGLLIKFLRGDVVNEATSNKFDYSVFDSEFEKRSAEIEKYVKVSKDVDSVTDASTFKVNINTATKEELMKLPGIGEQTAERIIQHRKLYGDFKRIEDIMNVKGIGQKKFEKIKRYLKTN